MSINGWVCTNVTWHRQPGQRDGLKTINNGNRECYLMPFGRFLSSFDFAMIVVCS